MIAYPLIKFMLSGNPMHYKDIAKQFNDALDALMKAERVTLDPKRNIQLIS